MKVLYWSSLLILSPALAIVLLDENIQSVFSALNREISPPEDHRQAIETFEEKLEKKLDEILHGFSDLFTDNEYTRTALDDAFDAVSIQESDTGNDLERFDAEAWVTQSRYANDQVFLSQGRDAFCPAGRRNRYGSMKHKHPHAGAPDDTDPRDGTDPGDGPPYHRDPKKAPPHHTPSPPSGYPHIRKPPMPPRDKDGPHTNSTMLDLISHSKHTSTFYDILKEHQDICDMLNDPHGNYTLFAPTNGAIERFQHKIGDIHQLPKEKVHRVLLYHMARGTHYSMDLKYHNTLMSMLPEDKLGKGMHQRLRMGLSYYGPTINFYSEIKMADVFAKNGVIHGIDALLLPPPEILDILEVLPTEFSTTEAAFFRTGLVKELQRDGDGLTIFLPSNRDWQKLGFMANAFLFSHVGTPYLRAIMKYHISPGHSLYSDAHVVPSEKTVKDERDDPSGLNHGYSHAYLPTMLKDRYISCDINRYERFLSFRQNGRISAVISDGIAKNGVIQVPDNILIPPHSLDEHRRPPEMMTEGQERSNPDEVSVDELKAILEPFVETERQELAKVFGESYVYGEEL